MKNEQIISDLILNRQNTLSVKHIQVIKDKNSLSNPKISVGTLPYYEWSKHKLITYVICYGRYLDCSMLCYNSFRKDGSFYETNSQKLAVNKLTEILNKL